ncbi:MAG: SPOR domain-containing protein [Magnetococcus sp. WYHC-3]
MKRHSRSHARYRRPAPPPRMRGRPTLRLGLLLALVVVGFGSYGFSGRKPHPPLVQESAVAAAPGESGALPTELFRDPVSAPEPPRGSVAALAETDPLGAVMASEGKSAKASGFMPGADDPLTRQRTAGGGMGGPDPLGSEMGRVMAQSLGMAAPTVPERRTHRDFSIRFYDVLKERTLVLPETPVRQGVLPVSLPSPPEPTVSGQPRFVVQLASFPEFWEAAEAVTRLKFEEAPAYLLTRDSGSGPVYLVCIGPFPNRADATQAALRWRVDGRPAVVMAAAKAG